MQQYCYNLIIIRSATKDAASSHEIQQYPAYEEITETKSGAHYAPGSVPIYEEILPESGVSKIRLTPCEAYAAVKETSAAALSSSTLTQEYEDIQRDAKMDIDLMKCVAYANPQNP